MKPRSLHYLLPLALAVLAAASHPFAQTPAPSANHLKQAPEACVQIPADRLLELGVAYAEGRCGPKDFVAAAQLFRKSCDQGVAEGCEQLGFLYYDGTGVTQDSLPEGLCGKHRSGMQ